MSRQQAASTPIGSQHRSAPRVSTQPRACVQVPRKTAPYTFTKQATRERADEGQRRGGERADAARAGCRRRSCGETAQVDEQLADETVQRRQAADRDRPDEEARRSAASPPEPPRWSISRVPVAWMTEPALEKQQGLEQGVVPDVEQRAGEAERHPVRTPEARPSSATPMPETMMPMFSTL